MVKLTNVKSKTRVKIKRMLEERNMRWSELKKELGISDPALLKALKPLLQSGLVKKDIDKITKKPVYILRSQKEFVKAMEREEEQQMLDSAKCFILTAHYTTLKDGKAYKDDILKTLRHLKETNFESDKYNNLRPKTNLEKLTVPELRNFAALLHAANLDFDIEKIEIKIKEQKKTS